MKNLGDGNFFNSGFSLTQPEMSLDVSNVRLNQNHPIHTYRELHFAQGWRCSFLAGSRQISI